MRDRSGNQQISLRDFNHKATPPGRPPKTYRTSPIEHISNIYRTYNIYRTFLEHLSNIYRTSIELLYRISIEHISKTRSDPLRPATTRYDPLRQITVRYFSRFGSHGSVLTVRTRLATVNPLRTSTADFTQPYPLYWEPKGGMGHLMSALTHENLSKIFRTYTRLFPVLFGTEAESFHRDCLS